MKYTTEIVIDRPIDKVVELFDSQENIFKWMKGLESFEHISGTPGEVGAKSRLKFKMGRREIEMIETITSKNLPHEFGGTYEAKGVHNIVRNRFVPIDANHTRHFTDQEFQFTGFMKIIGMLMPGAFKKQSMEYQRAFKEFVEKSS